MRKAARILSATALLLPAACEVSEPAAAVSRANGELVFWAGGCASYHTPPIDLTHLPQSDLVAITAYLKVLSPVATRY